MKRVQAWTAETFAEDFADEREYFTVTVFPQADKMGFTVMLKSAKTIDDEKQFFKSETAKRYADKNFPDAECVMIRKLQYRGRISSPFEKRVAGATCRESVSGLTK